jgi:hypothetical protein
MFEPEFARKMTSMGSKPTHLTHYLDRFVHVLFTFGYKNACVFLTAVRTFLRDYNVHSRSLGHSYSVYLYYRTRNESQNRDRQKLEESTKTYCSVPASSFGACPLVLARSQFGVAEVTRIKTIRP